MYADVTSTMASTTSYQRIKGTTPGYRKRGLLFVKMCVSLWSNRTRNICKILEVQMYKVICEPEVPFTVEKGCLYYYYYYYFKHDCSHGACQCTW